jgi:hypothetical protein
MLTDSDRSIIRPAVLAVPPAHRKLAGYCVEMALALMHHEQPLSDALEDVVEWVLMGYSRETLETVRTALAVAQAAIAEELGRPGR